MVQRFLDLAAVDVAMAETERLTLESVFWLLVQLVVPFALVAGSPAEELAGSDRFSPVDSAVFLTAWMLSLIHI